VNQKMKKLAVMLIALGLLASLLLSGCGLIGIETSGGGNGDGSSQSAQGSTQSQGGQQTSSAASSDSSDSSASAALAVIPEILIPTAPGIAVEENGQAIVDFSHSQDGYIMAKFLEETSMKIKLLITGPDGVQYKYTLSDNHEFEAFPLSSGNGTYEVGVFKQVDGSRYSQELATIIEVTLVDEFAPFLRPNQYVNFTQDSAAVRKAAELVAGKTEFMDKVAAIYHFVITNIEYDVHLAETVESDYLPDVDRILASGMGICFDYAALMAAMLRSQGIPTKLVIGYTGDVYHAWISVFSVEEGWLDNAIFFDGNEWRLVDPTFAASISANEMSQFIGDGTNYMAMFMH